MVFSFRDREAHRSGAPPRFAVVSDCDIDADARVSPAWGAPPRDRAQHAATRSPR
jgi:hypothetical protein